MGRLRHAWIGLALVVGCVGTPVPQPPAHQPPDPAAVRSETSSTGAPEVIGEAGAAEPGTTLWAVALDQTTDPVTSTVEADGSFRTGLFVPDGEEVRLQVRSDAGRSRPVDLRVPIAGEIVRPTEGCLLLAPELELDPTPVGEPATGAITVENACAAPARIAAASLRRPAPEWAIGRAPFDLAPGETVELAVRLIPDAPGAFEAILFLQVEAPSTDRRPVTLLGAGI